MTTLKGHRLCLTAVMVGGGLISSAFGSAFGVAAYAGPGGAGSSGCSNESTYNSNSGGSYQVLASGFNNSDYAVGSCSLSGSVSNTATGATSVTAQASESAMGYTSPGVYTSPTSSMASGAANLADGTFHIFADATAPNTLVGMGNNSGASMWDTITIDGLGATPTPVVLTLTMDGTIGGVSSGDSELLSLFVTPNTAPNAGSPSNSGQCEWGIGGPTENSNYGCFGTSYVTYNVQDNSTYGASSSNILVTITATMDLSNADPTFGFFANWSQTASVANCIGTYNSGCGTTNTLNFLNTAAFSLSTTDFTSASGQFLTTDASTPEPGTSLLAGLGLLAAGASRIRRGAR